MENPFDKFDAEGSGNPFDRFDTAPKASLGRTAGLTARNLVQGAAAIPATLLNIPAAAYNLGADAIQGGGKGFRFNEMNQNVRDSLTNLGLPNPETGGERVGSDIAQALVGGGAALKGAQMAQRAASPVVQGAARMFSAAPGKQGVSAGLAGGAAGLTREAGAPVPVQIAASLAAGAAPYARPSAMVRGGPRTGPEQRALKAGFTVPPATMENPSVMSKMLGAWSGKIKSQHGASAKNQTLVKQMAASSLGLPRDTILDDNVFRTVRQQAGRAYEDVKQAIPTIQTDPQFQQQIGGLGQINSQVGQSFPGLVKNDKISDLVSELTSKKDFPTAAGVEAVRILRADATKNLQAIGDPERNALGFAQRDAADAVDDLMDRNISANGNPGVIDKYRAARRAIAKSHDVESATNTATGEVDPRRFALLADRGKPLSGELATIAETANAFPKAMQMPSKFGGAEPLSILDIMAAGGAVGTGAMTGNLGTGALIASGALSRPLVRQMTLSDAYQNILRGQSAPLGLPGMIPAQATTLSTIFREDK